MKCEKFDVRGEGSEDYAALYTYIQAPSDDLAIDTRPLVIVCPGGAYAFTSDREAEPVALALAAMGCHAAVLRYSVAPAVYPAALYELARAVALVREHAAAWRVAINHIAVMGFSAGGHLAAEYCMSWSSLAPDAEVLRPNAMILGYPVITSGGYAHEDSFRNLLGERYGSEKAAHSLELQVNENVPRTFLWNTFADGAVPVQNSLLLAAALAEHHIPTEYHLYERGAHGLSLANRLTMSAAGGGVELSCENWIGLLKTWLDNWDKPVE